MTLSLTEAAAEKTKSIFAEEANDDSYLRLGVRGGGCSGLNYSLEIDTDPLGPTDVEFMSHDIKLVVDQVCLAYLDGTEVDYLETLYGGGFKFMNPNAQTHCGCGSSFTPK
jgi:iron-sulfur cluster assembly protein